jgi:hypothetical protein
MTPLEAQAMRQAAAAQALLANMDMDVDSDSDADQGVGGEAGSADAAPAATDDGAADDGVPHEDHEFEALMSVEDPTALHKPKARTARVAPADSLMSEGAGGRCEGGLHTVISRE